jgi:chemotaxis protein CheY-P-specific phosphatase CheC
MNVDTGRILAEVFLDILERIAFMFGEIVEMSDVSGIETESVHASIAFRGQIDGQIEIVAPCDFCTELAANMLGTDPNDDVAERRGIDSLRELLNITCGNFVTAATGNRSVTDVRVPSTRIIASGACNELMQECGWTAILVDENPILVRLSSGN